MPGRSHGGPMTRSERSARSKPPTASTATTTGHRGSAGRVSVTDSAGWAISRDRLFDYLTDIRTSSAQAQRFGHVRHAWQIGRQYLPLAQSRITLKLRRCVRDELVDEKAQTIGRRLQIAMDEATLVRSIRLW